MYLVPLFELERGFAADVAPDVQRLNILQFGCALGALGIGPNLRLFELAQDLGQTLLLAFVVKDTP